MKRVTHVLTIMALAALIASPLCAADKKKPAEGKRQGKGGDAIGQMLSKIELSEEQAKQVAQIKEKYGEQMKAAREALANQLTPEQRKARMEALKQAKADGKSPKEAREAVEAAVSLTAEQKEAAAKAEASMREVVAKVRAELKEVLTEEQVKKLGLDRQPRGEKKPGEKKPGEKKPREKKPAEKKKADNA